MNACANTYAIQNNRVLTLEDAILLAIRTNPNVQSSQLSYLEEKYNLQVEEWQFSPHYGFRATGLITRSGVNGEQVTNSQTNNIEPSVTLLTPYGSQFTLQGANNNANHYNPGLSLEIMQPLLRGFGKAVVEAALNNARDNEHIAKLNIESTLRETISAVINAYLDCISAERIIAIDQAALERAEKSVQQTKLFIKAGHKAGNELITVQANVASAKSQLENDKNNFLQARYALLNAIGLDPNSEINFAQLDLIQLIEKYRLQPLISTKQLALQNDIQYQIDQITLKGSTTRALLIAEDQSRWQLDVTATAATGNGTGGGRNAGINSLFNGWNQSDSIGVTLQIPIDDRLAKQAVMNAKIALEQAELSLRQEKWQKETNAINNWNLVLSSKRALIYADTAEKLQVQTYQISYQKYLHGLIDSLELQTAQLQLIQAQQILLNAKINYIKSLVNLDQLIGNTLKTWNVQMRL